MKRRLKPEIAQSPLLGFGIGFLLGFAITRNLLGAAVFGFLCGYIQIVILAKPRFRHNSGESFLKLESDYIQTILAISAAVIRTEQNSASKSVTYIESKLRKEFSAEFSNKAIAFLRSEITLPGNLQKHTDKIAFEFDNSAKIQLIHFLVGITAIDGKLTNSEYRILQDICLRIELPTGTLETILAMFRFRREQDQNSNHRTKPVSTSMLDDAFKILGLNPQASDQEIKKAYKKLAIENHPDKVTHLGEEKQKAASEKFKVIAAAYDLICKKRGIV